MKIKGAMLADQSVGSSRPAEAKRFEVWGPCSSQTVGAFRPPGRSMPNGSTVWPSSLVQAEAFEVSASLGLFTPYRSQRVGLSTDEGNVDMW